MANAAVWRPVVEVCFLCIVPPLACIGVWRSKERSRCQGGKRLQQQSVEDTCPSEERRKWRKGLRVSDTQVSPKLRRQSPPESSKNQGSISHESLIFNFMERTLTRNTCCLKTNGAILILSNFPRSGIEWRSSHLFLLFPLCLLKREVHIECLRSGR